MIAESLAAVSVALLLDFALGDPKNKFHPTVWIGTLIALLTPLARSSSANLEKLSGVYVVLLPVLLVVSLLALLENVLNIIHVDLLSVIVSIVVVGILLKTTLAVRGMERHALAVVAALEAGDLHSARAYLSMIVKRDTQNLDKDHIYSGVVESISENTSDGIIGPLFYFGLFGIFGSFIYRTVNTADSMIGYKTDIFKNIGWFAAICDRVLNYLPSRLTGIMMILSSMMIGANWRKSYQIMIRDGRNTASPNAGYPMAAMAGALDAKLEKVDHYSLGDGAEIFSKQHVMSAISVMKMTSILFGLVVVVPTITVLSSLGWWIHV